MLVNVVVPVLGHTYMTNLSIDGTKLAENKCIVKPWSNENFPEVDATKDTMRCRSASTTLNGEFCTVAAGSTISVHMHESGPDDRPISESHRGPVLAYMALADTNGEGEVWFKIFEDGYDSSSNVWGVDTFIKNNGKIDLVIPADIAPGNYLVRSEIIALHEGNRVYGADKDSGAQFYPSCALITVTGTGTATPKMYAIPGIYDKNDPGVLYDLWDDKPYVIPGPPVYVAGKAPAAAKVPPVQSQPTSSVQEPTPTPTPGLPKSKPCVRKRSNGRRNKVRARRIKAHQEM
ncbi:hypothetical protein IW139_002259 [Coemansia sp. RSA 353]|nr:hypothetical protein LPJ58_004987 [Coemansia sp. RSA 1591]KAJ1755857.1 hypothetical protein LPJ69_004960 [Coemansia sp. RSA 1752]KAJ1783015.1 hypothetical protein LPJ67_004872 [Coemansia sp. RSA 1938]KAJ2139184.1 hypothetical protein GGH17_000684 [Coemansia sp. RSA 788]KAJ2144945.1 hypothetical protein IW142_002868 [Coemansia sp. RSA 564]KAJ2168105.1 hypothetical protein GGH15_001653 [Coemansia sp. RSA 562]KAJ2176089.1 hypothetical protein GGH16_000336 [Coemansia sp. RSA 560]KAJ2190769.1 